MKGHNTFDRTVDLAEQRIVGGQDALLLPASCSLGNHLTDALPSILMRRKGLAHPSGFFCFECTASRNTPQGSPSPTGILVVDPIAGTLPMAFPTLRFSQHCKGLFVSSGIHRETLKSFTWSYESSVGLTLVKKRRRPVTFIFVTS